MNNLRMKWQLLLLKKFPWNVLMLEAKLILLFEYQQLINLNCYQNFLFLSDFQKSVYYYILLFIFFLHTLSYRPVL